MRVIGWTAWAIATALVLVGLGWQVSYANERAACLTSDRLVLCSGPMADWLMPLSVAIGLALVAAAAWRLMAKVD